MSSNEHNIPLPAIRELRKPRAEDLPISAKHRPGTLSADRVAHISRSQPGGVVFY